MVTETMARRAGLTRGWRTQVAVNHATDRITHVALEGEMLFVQTSGATLQALDPETGRTLWSVTVGQPNLTTLAPSANNRHVATVNGSTLYLLDKTTGAVEWSRRLKGAPGAGPVVTKTHVIVPIVTGMLEGYEIANRGPQTPWIYQSFGRIFTQPVISNELVSWTTDKGNLYVAKADPMIIKGRLQTRSAIESRPAYWTPCFYACSLDGYLYAVHEKTTQTQWRFSAGEPIRQPPVAVEGHVYVIPQFSGMFCLNADHGAELWNAQGVSRFISQSKTRVYAIDKLNQLAILDAATGARLGGIPVDPGLRELSNAHTDRIYLYSATGMIECLHEAGATQPVVHQPPPSESSDLPAAAPKAKKKAEEGAEEPAADGAKGDDMKADEMKADDAKPADGEMKLDDAGAAMGDEKKPAKKEDSPF
jgi:outer membrane protein assembly factor BamB